MTNISWRQQRYGNSCAWDCLCMLLSGWGVDVDTEHLIRSSPVPYSIRLEEDGDSVRAGMLVQDEAAMNAAILSFGLRLQNSYFESQAEYTRHATHLLQSGTAFMTSLRRADGAVGDVRRHAIVFHGLSDGSFVGLDPDAGLDRSREYCFEEVRDQVIVDLSRTELGRAAMGDEPRRGIVGVVTPVDESDLASIPYRELMDESLAALDHIETRTVDLDFTAPSVLPLVEKVLKPIAHDLRIAVSILDGCSTLEGLLGDMEAKLLLIRAELTARSTPDPCFCGDLEHLLANAYTHLREHLRSAPVRHWEEQTRRLLEDGAG